MPSERLSPSVPQALPLDEGKKWTGLPLLVLAFGAVSVVLLLVSDQLRQRSIFEDSLSQRSCEAIRADLAISHLWLEEFVSGDRIEDGVIDRHLATAIEHVDQLAGITGVATSATDPLAAPPLHSVELRRQAASLRPLIQTFRTLSDERREGYRQSLPVGIGSALDIEYDRVFADLLQATRRLEDAVLEHGQAHQSRARRTFWTLIGLWSLVVAAAALGLRVRQGRQQRTERALSESHAQLTHSQRRDAAGRLAGGLAHDLSNYLAAIRGHCELARLKSAADSPMAKRMDQVLHTVDRAAALVDGLMSFGRRQATHPTVLALGELVQNLSEMLAPSMGDRVHVETRIEDAVHPVLLDRAGIEQTLANLLVNARDSMPGGGSIRLTVANTAAVPDAPAGVEITVQDEGVGIPPHQLGHIFEPFWTTKNESGGSGLGLSTVHSFVQQSNGRIEVDSTPDVGTTFRLFFPRCETPQDRPDRPPESPSHRRAANPEATAPSLDSAAPSPESPSADDGSASPAKPMATGSSELSPYEFELLADSDLEGDEKILLVDDNDSLRLATEDVLKALGYDVVSTDTAHQALQLAAEHDFDLWIVDWVLPDLDGYRLIESLRRQQTRRQESRRPENRRPENRRQSACPIPALLISGHRRENLTHDDGSPVVLDAGTEFISKHGTSALHLARHLRQRLDGNAPEPSSAPTA